MDATEKTACVPRDEKDRNNKSMVLDQHIIELDDLEEPGTSKAAFNDIQKEQSKTDEEVLSHIQKTLVLEVKETCDFDFPKKEGNVFKSVLTNTVQQVNSNEILDDFIIDLDDSLEIEEQESEKIDPLADTDETAATGTHIDAKTLEIEKKSEVALLSNLIQMTEDSTDEAVENMKKPIKSKCTSNEENFVICIDTDDEDEKQSESILNADVIKQPDEPSKEINPLELTVIEISATSDINTRTESQTENKKRNSDELSSPNQETDQQISNEPPLKMPRLPKLIECVNIMCPKIYNSTYTTASKFILHFFYVPSKLNREQFVCNFCTDNAVDKFEMISGALLQGERVCDLELPKRAELVEIIDSDEESVSENNNEAMIIDDSKKIVWDQEVMNDIENMVLEYKHKIDFQQQADWGDDRLKIMQEKQKESLSELDEKLKSIEKLSSKMYNNLYSVNKTKVERRDSVSFSDEGQQCSSPDILVSREQRPLAQYPPARNAKINRNNLQNDSVSCENIQKKGSFWCALRSKIWAKCKLLEVVSSYENATTKNKYRVQFLDNLPNSIAIVGGFEIANTLLIENFVVGTRVIADFSQSKNTDNSHILGLKKYLPGVILEKQTNLNKRRYLVHSEYGHYRYIAADSVLKIVEQFGAAKMAEIHPKISVKLDARVPVELNGSWRNADVAEIDCSLVKVRFIPENLEEWLYCGSKRWGPVQTQATRSPLNFRKQNGKSISFIAVGDDGGSDDSDEFLIVSIGPKSVAKKSTAKKSTQPVKLIRSGSSTSQGVSAPLATSEPPIQKVHILNDDKIYIDEPPQVSILRKFTPRKDLIPKQYVPHTCSRHCCPGPKPALASYSTLTKPLLSCWERQIVKHKTFKHIIYKAPCGRRLRNMNEIHKYLKITQNRFNVDNFDYDPTITVMTFYGIKQESCGLYLDDLAGGKEGMPIPVVNAFDNQQPPDMQYSSVRIPTKNVRIDKDPGFLMCCDCTDDCADKSKCACFQNTIAGAKFRNIMDLPAEDISYKFKRLHNMVQTGIYECNINCKCNERCFNRVVQQPIQIKMQLYRTKNRGWGLECLHDIPKGTFICTYVGYLYPEKEANALCANEAHGDEYFAELDYIENVQGLKEGYEAGVQFDDTDDDEDEKNSDSDSDYNEQVDQQDDDITGNAAAASKRAIATRSSTQTRPKRSGSGKQGEQTGNETLENQDEDDLTTEDSETLEEQHKKVPKPGTSKSDSSSDDEDQSEAKKDHINLISDDETIKSLPDEPVTAKPPSVNMVTKSIRKMFGPKEKVYILDAKQCGNVGRYFNHSCMPNLFVQSVFVDSHDPRFPWVSFFASTTIKAGTELTWNYNYDVGSVPGKVLYCKCGSTNCRTRIL